MPDLLTQASTWLNDQRHTHLTRPVTYQRGQASVELPATIGQTVFRLEDGYGQVTRTVSRDYLIRAEDLQLDGEATLPKRGDVIRETDHGTTHVHEVMAPDSREPNWRYSDPQRTTLRIHTKQIGVESP
ncbi:MAG: hypothetical protein WD534_12975 [Phycisphaeraceae bacterium]